jgi:CubicO group peptidase (beta-lactamase class C family)
MAIDKGFIQSTDQKVLDFFPDYIVKRGEKTIQQVTLKHLLTMTAPYKYKSEPWTKVCTSEDWTKAALDLLGGRSGITGEFKYSTLGIHILNGIISASSGMSVIDFINDNLFQPLEIKKHMNKELADAEEHRDFILSKQPKGNVWITDPKGVNTAGWGLCLSSSDMAKIGQLCLKKGIYNGKHIISSEWIDEMTSPYYCCDDSFGCMTYGYLWWLPNKKTNIYAAIGDGGNVIYVNPDRNTVIAVASAFKPMIFDRVQFIQEQIEPLI